MASPLSHITIEELKRLNTFALSESPSSQENLARALKELAGGNGSIPLCGKTGYLVVGGKGICERDSYVEIEAILDFPDFMQHPVEQVSACVALLRRPANQLPDTMRHKRAEIQRRLSHILIKYPVLMDHRLVYAVAIPHLEWSSLGVALAEASFASLPSTADGLSHKQLMLFACNPSVKSSLSRPNEKFVIGTASTLNSKTALEVCANGVGTATPPSDILATRGGFISSYLALSDIARSFTGRALLDPQKARFNDVKLYVAIARAVWDVAIHQGLNGSVTPEQLRKTLALRSPFAKDGPASCAELDPDHDRTVATATRNGFVDSNQLLPSMALLVNEWLFEISISNASQPQAIDLGDAVLARRTRSFMSTTVELGLFPSQEAAGNWLVSVTVGPLRSDMSKVGPRTGPASIMGFLQALHEVGVSVEWPSKPAAMTWGPSLVNWETWATATQVFATTKAMEGVYAKHDAIAAASPSQDLAGNPGQSTVAISRPRRRLV